jgi:hypothetical protein
VHQALGGDAALAQRQEPVRLLVLGTYHPVETVLRAQPLRSLVQGLVRCCSKPWRGDNGTLCG